MKKFFSKSVIFVVCTVMFFLVCCISANTVNAQVVYSHSFSSGSVVGNNYNQAPDVLATGLTVGSTQWSGGSGGAPGLGNCSGNQNLSMVVARAGGSNQLILTLNVSPEYTLNLSSISAKIINFINGVNNGLFVITVNNKHYYLSSHSSNILNCPGFLISPTSPLSLSGTVTIVISATNASSAFGFFQIDDFVLNGTLSLNSLDNLGLGSPYVAESAYSLRKLRNSYQGNAIQVRRSNDNTTQNIGFTAVGDLDTTALKSFVGSNNAFVTTWYDQSGFGRNLMQTETANQPTIISGGIIFRRNTRPTIYFDATNDGMVSSGNDYASDIFTVNLVAGSNANSNTFRRAVQGSSFTNNWLVGPYNNTHAWYAGDFNHLQTTPWSTSQVERFTVVQMPTGIANTSYRNGNSITTGNNKSKFPGKIYLGGTVDFPEYLDGYISEVVCYNWGFASPEVQSIETSQAAYYALATNANLSSLATTAGTLTPSFTAVTTAYTASVSNATNNVTVTPTKAEANATIAVRVNGGAYTAVTSGSASSSLALSVGSNTIDVRVTAQDGTTIKTYTITVTRAASNNANLSALTTTAGTLTPSFTEATTTYTASVSNATNSVTVTPTKAEANATITIRVNGGIYTAVTSGSASSSLALNTGSNTIDVWVIAQDGTTSKKYNITITRATSSNADLSTLTTTAGALTPAFAANTISYTASVNNATTSVTVTPTTAEANATIAISLNNAAFVNVNSGTASSALALNEGANTIAVKVTAQDGTTIKTYTITVTRTGPLSALGISNKIASSAYSLRKLGNNLDVAIQVRRSSDNNTQNIGFTSSGDLDTASLKTFVGTGSGFVTIWYDQSSNQRDLSQTNTANQPILVNAGSILRKNDKPTIYFDASNDGMLFTGSNYLTANPLSVNLVAGSNANTNATRRAVQGSATTNNWLIGPYTNAHVWFAGGFNHIVTIPWSTNRVERFTVIQAASASNTSFRNGTSVTSDNNKSSFPGKLSLGASGGYAEPLDGFISEVVSYAAELTTTEIQSMESSQSTYYASSANANLIALSTTATSLSPSFNLNFINYTANVTNATSSITVTPTLQDANASIEVRVNNGSYVSLSNGTTSGALSLNIGSNTINIRVTAQNGTSTKIYSILVERASDFLDVLGINGQAAASAYSLRKLSSVYTGSAIQVRRSSDNATQNIGFTAGGDLDTASLKTFVGTSSGFVTIWYDQSSNLRNLTQTTEANQPTIVNAGVIFRRNNKPTVFLDGSNDGMIFTGTDYLTSEPLSVNVVAGSNSNVYGARRAVQGVQTPGNNSSNWLIGPYNSGHAWYTGYWVHEDLFNEWSTTQVERYTVVQPSGSSNPNISMKNGVGLATFKHNLIWTAPKRLCIGAAGYNEPLNGFISEVVSYASALSTTEIQNMETSQAAYYALANNANLLGISTTPTTTLSPSFIANTLTYTTNVGNAASTITISPTKEDASATVQVRVNGGAYATVTGATSSALALNVGANTIDVLVTAQNGTTTKTYTIIVTRSTGPLTILGINNVVSEAAYSLRQLSPAYTNPLVRVTINSNTYDVWPDATGNFSMSSVISAANPTTTPGTKNGTTALSTVATGNTATIAIWYNQSGADNNYNISQTSVIQQPRVINAGTIEMQNGKPTAFFNAGLHQILTSQTYTFTNFGSGASLLSVLSKNASLAGSAFALNGGFTYFNIYSANATSVRFESGSSILQTTTQPIIANKLFQMSGTGNEHRIDGVNLLTGTSSGLLSSNFSSRFTVGEYAGYWNGYISEIICFPSTLSSANRLIGENNQIAYYGTGCNVTAPTASAQTFCANANPTVANLVATGTAPKWYAALTGGAELASTTALATGNYYASQTVSGCESTRTLVSVTLTPNPAGSTLATAIEVAAGTANYNHAGNNLAANCYPTTPTNSSPDVWYKVNVNACTILNINTCTGSDFDTRLFIYAPNGTTLIAENDDVIGCGTGSQSSITNLNVAAYPFVYVVVDGFNNFQGNYTLNITQSSNIPTAPTASAQTFCANANPTIANLVATGTAIKWYAASTGGTELASTIALATGNYYVSQTAGGCESARTLVSVTVTPASTGGTLATAIEVAAGTASYNHAGNNLAANCFVNVNGQASPEVWYKVNLNTCTMLNMNTCTGSNFDTYLRVLAPDGTTQLTFNDDVIGCGSGTQSSISNFDASAYSFVYVVVEGYENNQGSYTLNITQSPTLPAAPTATVQAFCGNTNPTIASLVASGTNIKWYAAATGGTELASTTALASGNYYASQTVGGCESARTLVSITINAIPTITLGTVTAVSTTATSFSLPYSATTGSPNEYSITTGTPTAMPSFSAVTNTTLAASPITVNIPASAANTYNFNLTVRNSVTGCVSSVVPFTVTVNVATAVFQPSDTVIYQGRSVQFTNSSVGLTSSSWNFGDGTFSTATSPSKVFSTPGTFNVTLSINGGASTAMKSIIVLPKLGTPYLLSDGGTFDDLTGSGHFAAQTPAGTAWEKGQSTVPGKDGAQTAPSTWVTGLTGNYVANTEAYLYTPNFNFMASGIYNFSFYAKFDTEFEFDGFRVEYSIDTGKVWQPLGTTTQAGWYNFANTGFDAAFPRNQAFFSGTNGSFTKYNYNISTLAGNNNVAFRFAFKSDFSVNASGVAIDNFEIAGPINAASTTIWNGITWSNGTPTSNVDAVINSSVAPASFTCKALTINSGVALTTTGIIATVNGNIVNNGIGIEGTGGLIVNANSTISGNAINFNGALTVNNGATLTTGGLLTLASNATNTARIANSAGTITGNVTIERYIPSGRRAFRFLGHPFTTAQAMSSLVDDIFVTGDGTIDGSGNSTGAGLDATTTNDPSSYWFDNTTNTWKSFTTAADASWAQHRGTRILVRGDRTQTTTLTGANPTPLAVTLDMTGAVNTGNQNISLPTANNFHLLSNPYPSPTDIGTVIQSASNVGTLYWVWNANAGARGQYVNRLIADGAYNLAMNGAFFVQPTAATSLAFTEANKTVTATQALYRTASSTRPAGYLELAVKQNNEIADNIYIRDLASSSTTKDIEDGGKLINPDINIYTLTSNNEQLTLDARPISSTTVIPVVFTSNIQTSFSIEVIDNGFGNGLPIVLKDKFLNTEHVLTATSPYNFTVTSNAASQGNNRFELVFKSSAALPTTFVQVAAQQKGSAIEVTFNTANETNMHSYEVEESKDGSTFTKGTTLEAKNATANNYSWLDVNVNNGNNYYRVKAIEKNGVVKYSQVVRVNIGTKRSEFTVYPNPVKGGTINLQLTDIEKGVYTVKVVNNLGQEIAARTITHNGGSATQTISIGNAATGKYNMVITNGTTSVTKTVIVE